MDSDDFVENAAQGGIAEIEAGKLALEKSTSADVKAFAEKMVADHGKANKELKALASKLDIKVPDDAELTDKAKKMILDLREGSFDPAYANNQVNAHENAVKLFTEASESADKPQIKAFATQTLPTLKHHLEMAKKLQSAHK
ncbi:hypothetical protein D3C75_1097860 [compost metagenome]